MGTNFTRNIRLKSGSSIPAGLGSAKSVTVDYITFEKMDVVNDRSELSNHPNYLREMMVERKYLMWIAPMSDPSVLSRISELLVGSFLSEKDLVKYGEMASACVTPFNSVMPQGILCVDEKKSVTGNVLINRVPSGRRESFSGWYKWKGVSIGRKMNLADLSDSEEDAEGSSSFAFGTTDNDCRIDNTTARGVGDDPIIRNRKYSLKISNSYAGEGAICLCYHIIHSTPESFQDKSDSDETKQTGIKLWMNTKKEDEYNDQSTGISGNLKIFINHKGSVTVTVGKYKKTGTMGGAKCKVVPYALKTADGQTHGDYMLIYILRGGIVVTNSLYNSANEAQCIQIPFPATSEPRGNIGVFYDKKSLSQVGDSADERNNLATAGGLANFSWFPSLCDETHGEWDNITVLAGGCLDAKTPRKMHLITQRCLGKFSYQPLMFSPAFRVCLYCKAPLQGSDSNSGIVRQELLPENVALFPLVAPFPDGQPTTKQLNVLDNLSTDRDGYTGWKIRCGNGTGTGNDGSGGDLAGEIGNFKYINGTYGLSKIPIFDTGCKNSALHYSVYCMDMLFLCDGVPRKPIEMFGIMRVEVQNNRFLTALNGNGSFVFGPSDWARQTKFTGMTAESYWDLITSMNVNASLDGPTGDFSLDIYPTTITKKDFTPNYSIGEISVDVVGAYGDSEYSFELFKGYVVSMESNFSGNNYSVNGQMDGVQRKLKDMQVICAPYWDGDKLEKIAEWFSAYTNVCIKMIDHTVTNISGAKSINTSTYSSWTCDVMRPYGSMEVKAARFRVPRSVDWRSPAVNFQTGKNCYDALSELGTMTSCLFLVQPDGIGYFMEMNKYGYPCYVENQSSVASFGPEEITSVRLSPYIEDKFNLIVTFGFLKIETQTGIPIAEQFVPAIEVTNIVNDKNLKGVQHYQFPWSRPNVNVEKGMVTKEELRYFHQNRVKFSMGDNLQGSLNVAGNNKVTHIYQSIKVNGMPFFVSSISHSMDLQQKTWTTSYGLSYFKRTGDDTV